MTAAEISEASFLNMCYEDPAFFAREVIGIEPTAQQLELFAAVSPDGAHVAVRSGHGTGKTTALAAIAIWFVLTRDDALVPCTAPSAHQLDDILWAEMRRLVSRMTPYMQAQLAIKKADVDVEGSDAGFMVARTARPEKPDALQGFHSKNILFIIDEAAGVHDRVFEVARGALSTPGARVVMTGNPTQLTGYFHNAFHINRDSWIRLHFSCLESPLVAPNYAEDMKREYGEDSDIYRIRVLGEFPRAGLRSIIPADRVDAAMERTLRLGSIDHAPGIIGVDPAWEGSDRSSIVLRKGVFAKVLFVGLGLHGDELASRVMHFQDAERAEYTFVDKTGVGASCCDFLRTAGRKFLGISFAQRPLDDRFLNRRAEIWWRMREWFLEDVALAPHPDIKADLIAPEYGTNDLGKIYLESKESMRERGIPSPDLGDALALTFAAPVHAKSGQSVTNSFSKNFNPYSGIESRR